MAARRAFYLNLDADLELAARGPYAPSRAIEGAIDTHARALAPVLVPEGDVVITRDTPAGALDGARGFAWSPTPRARARLLEVGATPSPSPSLEVLRRVSRRDFAYVTELPDSGVFANAEDALAHIACPPSLGDGYRLKRVFGMSGRGHRVVRGRTTKEDESFVRASTAALIVEPNVHIVRELSLHGFLYRDGRCVHGDPCESVSDARGAFVSTRVLDALEAPYRARLEEALEESATALVHAGYFGPFGIDGFLYEQGSGHQLRARSETNARYSMGWGVGFRAWGDSRPDLEEPT